MGAVVTRLLGIPLLLLALVGAGCSCTPTGPGFAVRGDNSTGVGAPVMLTGWVNNGVEVTDHGDVQKRRKVEAGIEWSVAEGPANGASIDSNGKFVARKPGTYTVQAKMGQELATHKIEVAAEPDEDSAEASGTQYMEEVAEPADPATLEEIILSGNGMAVHNGGKPFTFTIDKPRRIREIWSYHWNNEKGKAGGTITLKGASGETRYKVTRTAPGQGGVPNAYWIADTDFVIQPGTYTFIDSDPASWAQNAENGGKGMGWIKVVKE